MTVFGSSTSPSPLPLPKLSLLTSSIRNRTPIQQGCVRERAAAADKSNDNHAMRMIFAWISRAQKYFFMKKESRRLSLLWPNEERFRTASRRSWPCKGKRKMTLFQETYARSNTTDCFLFSCHSVPRCFKNRQILTWDKATYKVWSLLLYRSGSRPKSQTLAKLFLRLKVNGFKSF